jgi:hypothetical protein
MKQTLCEPRPNKFLQEGFAVVWDVFDGETPFARTRLVAADCK